MRKISVKTVEYDILMFIYNNPAYNTAADIVRIRKSTKSHVSTSLKVLEDRGFIERRVDKDNKKHVTIHLLQLANEVIEDGIWAQKEFAQDMFEGLSEEEIKVFMSVFQKVYDNAERMISNEKNS
ncbi:MAG: MarR family winged helix-turn-helix transcriptional regulator [Holdemanella porci]